ncbi:sugar transferase [Microbacterium sp. nov. GSS16]|uniref:sugar transferase n=1 Tax=Microbacterium sp. nov. GSS16 TaxID=3019890 RepID=UPI0023067E1A|nr:sugar transferase [Microbacterium sp. nov. GSS16]WCD92899.1 sugar transferase [Microbacterium sp. nov. GSS16]
MSVGTPAWETRYGRKLLLTDVVVVIVAVFGAQALRFGSTLAELQVPLPRYNEFAVTYAIVSAGLVVAWLFALAAGETRHPTVFGIGPTEYKRVVNSTLFVFGALAIVAYLAKADIGRGYLLIALPLGMVLLLFARWFWRRRLHTQRQRGRNMYRTVVVGERNKVAHVTSSLTRDAFAGFDIAGVITEHGTPMALSNGAEVLGSYDDILDVVQAERADTLIMVNADRISPRRLREIGWELDQRRVDLIVAASLTDVAGPRIHARPVAGMPLIHVEHPRLTGRRRFVKRSADVMVSALGLVVLSPLFLVLAILVRTDSPGAAFFRQQRIGLNGKSFAMLKFRSMVADAEDRLPGLLDQSDGNGVLFKMRSDPRVTRIGAFLRKYSLDELPQLVNVLRGEMSLVGPRPPLAHEVEQYDQWTRRRLLVKPGITGLWQVSGRSDLTWEDSVRLDLYYVENWSLVGDILIVLRTVAVVIRSTGSY